MQINELKIVPNWRLENANGEQLHVTLLPLLEAIQKHGKLTSAAQSQGLSYRHAWNILQEADAFFNQAVASKARGKGAELTDLGKALVQANQRIDARLHPQMESLAMELNSAVHTALSDRVKVMRIYASHGYAVALIPSFLEGFQTELHYHGSADALKALHSGVCKVAGFTMPVHHRIQTQRERYAALLDRSDVRVLGFIKRQQGLIYDSTRTTHLNSDDGLHVVSKNKLRFINRQPYSGTRELFDTLLMEQGISSKQILGYDQYEYTHTAVAAQIATGMADVGFGMQAAAARFDLDFLPLTEDVYLWAYRREFEGSAEVQRFKEMLLLPEFQIAVNALPGYDCERCGELIDYAGLIQLD